MSLLVNNFLEELSDHKLEVAFIHITFFFLPIFSDSVEEPAYRWICVRVSGLVGT